MNRLRNNLNAIAIMWLRDMKHFTRSPARIIGSLTMPFLLMVSLGMGFGRMVIPGMPEGTSYLQFLVPGMVGMTVLFSGTFAGMSVLWDRQFGFLKEIMVAPVSRLAIVIGRLAGGVTLSVVQGILILLVSMVLGYRPPTAWSIILAVLPMLLISMIFISIGLIFASRMKDEQGFGLIMNFLIMPLFFLSGAFFPVSNLPGPIAFAARLDPLMYGIEALRAVLNGSSYMAYGTAMTVTATIAGVLALAGAWFFETSESI